jgi:hypothetical protein
MLGDLERAALVDEHDLIPPVDGEKCVRTRRPAGRNCIFLPRPRAKTCKVELAVQLRLGGVLKSDIEQICTECTQLGCML